MTRALVFAALVSVLAAVGGCDDGGDSSAYSWGGPPEVCRQYQSCGSCTPIAGCGWCTGPSGDGVCASDPDFCPTEEFSWTWDPTGCRTLADASVVGAADALSSGDAGTLVGDSESSKSADASDAELTSQTDVVDGGDATSRDAAPPCSASSGDASDASAAPCD